MEGLQVDGFLPVDKLTHALTVAQCPFPASVKPEKLCKPADARGLTLSEFRTTVSALRLRAS